jgi:hypothetical protein
MLARRVSFEVVGLTLFVVWAWTASLAFSVKVRFRGPFTGSTGSVSSRGIAGMAHNRLVGCEEKRPGR